MSTPTMQLPEGLLNLGSQVEQHLSDYLVWDSGCPERLAAAIRYSVLAPGKRLRPMLVLAAAEMCGANPLVAMPAACAVEMIHAYSLIHDDLPAMDDDDLRRGRPACHRQFDEATAILAGDALIPLAFEVLCRDLKPESVALRACLELSRAAGAAQLVGGQADDLAAPEGPRDLALLEKIHLRKTAAMLAVSLKLGAICAEASEDDVSCLELFGRHLGLAFQISDDLLDLKGEQDKMGKRVGKDQSKGKLTYPALIGPDQSEALANQLIDSAVQSLERFGPKAAPLISLAKFVTSRTR